MVKHSIALKSDVIQITSMSFSQVGKEYFFLQDLALIFSLRGSMERYNIALLLLGREKLFREVNQCMCVRERETKEIGRNASQCNILTMYER